MVRREQHFQYYSRDTPSPNAGSILFVDIRKLK